MKKLRLIGVFTMALGTLIFFQGSAPSALSSAVESEVRTLEQTPPEVKNIWVQTLAQPQPGGNMIMEVEFDTSYCYETIRDTIDLFYDSIQKITFRDQGIYPDVAAGDGIFSTLVFENISAFKSEILAKQTAMAVSGGYFSFTGHSGRWNDVDVTLDLISLDAHLKVPVDPAFFTYTECSSILKENSLFITDIDVVEDLSRTNNIATSPVSGNSRGYWTFAYMIEGMCGKTAALTPTYTYIQPKALLKSWVKNWTVNLTLNGQTVESRDFVYETLIRPWLTRSGVSIPSSINLNATNWEGYWNGANQELLLDNAPFRLTAIVNRLDLRGNSSFSGMLNNTGETRFIFTLIDYESGMPTRHPDQDDAGVEDFIDWKGLNIILEYGNPAMNTCELKRFAQKWVDLSGMVLGSPAYNTELEKLTKIVTEPFAGGSGKVNQSALNQLRTNEKIFSVANKEVDWGINDWEFRQFELDATTHEFKQVSLPNVPMEYANNQQNLNVGAGSEGFMALLPSSPYESTAAQDLVDLIFTPGATFLKNSILRGNHNLPKYNPYHPTRPILAAAGRVRGEFSHYLDMAYYPTFLSWTAIEKEEYENVRHQLSLNTCQGCHTGENKTIFTHVSPLGYGDTANYWVSTPASLKGQLDVRSTADDAQVPINIGSTFGGHKNYWPRGAIHVSGTFLVKQDAHYQNVSAFLTGRSFTGPATNPGTFDDDNPTDADDNNMEGLFYVYDPSNHYGVTGSDFPANNLFGYNDLKRRQDDLCRLVNSECNFSILNLATKMKFVPMGLKVH